MTDPLLAQEHPVRYTYWPVSYLNGNPTVISNAPLPLSGVQFSTVMRGVGELRASLQLADPEVRALDPWSLVVPRKTGIVVVREINTGDVWTSSVVWHGVVWQAPRNPHTGRMEITAHSVESVLARRRITKAMTWSGADQISVIAADLLDPAKFSLIPLGASPWPGWITIDPPTTPSGVARDFHYEEGQETNLLEAHQNRSQLATNSYEWYIDTRILSGVDAVSASTYRPQFITGFPKLGRQLGSEYPTPRLLFDTRGAGNVTEFNLVYDGSQVANIVWARGNGYDDLQTRAQVQSVDDQGYTEWQYGFLQLEDIFSDPDVTLTDTLISYAYRYMWQKMGSEQFISKLTIRGDVDPVFGTYVLGDELILKTNDLTWPPSWYDSNGFVELIARVYGWVVTPPEADQTESVSLLVSGGTTQ